MIEEGRIEMQGDIRNMKEFEVKIRSTEPVAEDA